MVSPEKRLPRKILWTVITVPTSTADFDYLMSGSSSVLNALGVLSYPQFNCAEAGGCESVLIHLLAYSLGVTVLLSLIIAEDSGLVVYTTRLLRSCLMYVRSVLSHNCNQF